MCGIVGYVGERPCRGPLPGALERLEHRGYASAGLSLLADGQIESMRTVGNLQFLKDAVEDKATAGAVATAESTATTGIGHTRWATHGRVTEANAHPHYDNDDRVHIVLNGIVENFSQLREQLQADGAVFTSETDAEVVAHLIARRYDGDLVEAVRVAYSELRGHYAFVVMHADEPGVLVGARKECPLVVGVGEVETFIASAIPAFLAYTRKVGIVGDDELIVIRPGGAEFLDAVSGEPVTREIQTVDWDNDAAEKGGFETFMLKEIYEQADAVAETVADRVHGDTVELGELGISDEFLRDLRRIVIA